MAGTPVCETVTGRTTAELRAARDRALAADLIELRLDGVSDPDVAGALAGRSRPAIVTCRPTWEGGRFDGPEQARLKLLGEAIRLGAEYVDVEWKAERRGLPSGSQTRIILSHHVFDAVPEDLESRVAAMWAEKPDVVKIAVGVNRLGECLRLRDAVRGDRPKVAIAMGDAGLVTRVHPSWMGSSWTYAGDAAPGQLPAARLIDTFRVRQTSADTAVYALLGQPLGHSASPAMHNAAFADLGLDAVYVPLESRDPADVLSFAEAVGLHGASVTAPLKEALCARVTPSDEPALATGAVNTLRWRGDVVEGRNFDAAGFLAPLLQRGIRLSGMRAVVLGAGGAARAAAWALRGEGAEVRVAARRREPARALADAMGLAISTWPPEPGWDLLVNATPVGTWPDTGASPLAAADLSGRLVYDLVYNPRQTRLMSQASAAGLTTIGGLEMLVEQAARQCEWWTGRRASAAVLERAAVDFLGAGG